MLTGKTDCYELTMKQIVFGAYLFWVRCRFVGEVIVAR